MFVWPFSKSVAPAAETAPQEPAVELHAPDCLTTPDQISRLLEQIHEHRCLLTVGIHGFEELYTSAIIEVVRAKKYFVLDELAPRAGNALMRPRQRLSIRARLNNVTIRFDTEVTAIGEQTGLPYYQLTAPGLMEYIQRREHYRAGVPMEKHVPVQFTTAKGTLFNGELRDISLGGFSTRLRAAPLDELAPGNVIDRFVITLPSNTRVCGSGQICYADMVQSALVARCGVRFEHVDRMDYHALEHFIAQLDREMKRKRLA